MMPRHSTYSRSLPQSQCHSCELYQLAQELLRKMQLDGAITPSMRTCAGLTFGRPWLMGTRIQLRDVYKGKSNCVVSWSQHFCFLGSHWGYGPFIFILMVWPHITLCSILTSHRCVQYAVCLYAFSATGFSAAVPLDQPLLSQSVTVVTENPPGVKPHSHAPPGYVRTDQADYNNSVGYLENGNQRFYHRHGFWKRLKGLSYTTQWF